MQPEIEEFLLYLAAERGLSDHYQLSTRLSLEAFFQMVFSDAWHFCGGGNHTGPSH